MEHQKAKYIAVEILDKLAPYCDRIEIAGSIRRGKPQVKDIEIVCIPKRVTTIQEQAGLFETMKTEITRVTPEFINIVNSYKKVKGEPTGRYTQRIIPVYGGEQVGEIKLDLFMVYADNWGLQFAIRTGSADYSHFVLGRAWVKHGFGCIEGYLHRYIPNSTKPPVLVPVPEEKDLYRMINLSWIEPSKREVI